jgi:hypothetical protein
MEKELLEFIKELIKDVDWEKITREGLETMKKYLKMFVQTLPKKG